VETFIQMVLFVLERAVVCCVNISVESIISESDSQSKSPRILHSFIVRRSRIAVDRVGREQIEGSATGEVEDKPLF
jgi:hypothetical protein